MTCLKKRLLVCSEIPFGTANNCPLGVDLYGNFKDGVWRLALTWEEVATLAREKGKKLPSAAMEKVRRVAKQYDLVSSSVARTVR